MVIASMPSRLDNIAQQQQRLERRLIRLDTLMAPKLYRTRRHAQDFAALTEMAVHWLDALRDGSMKLDSIVRLDTIVQTVKVLDRTPAGSNSMEITIDGAELSSSAWRVGLTFAIDVPILNLFNR